ANDPRPVRVNGPRNVPGRFRRGERPGQLTIRSRRCSPGATSARSSLPAIMIPHKLSHLRQRRAGEKDPVHTLLSHDRDVFGGDGSAASAEDANISSAPLAKQRDYFREEFDVPTVVTGESHRTDVFLDGCPGNVARRTVITEVNDFHSMAHEFQIDGVDRAVVPIADGDGSEDANRP